MANGRGAEIEAVDELHFGDQVVRRADRVGPGGGDRAQQVVDVARYVVLGDGVKRVTGHSALYGSVPLVSLIGATSGAIIVAVGVMRERDDGLLSRFWVVPSPI